MIFYLVRADHDYTMRRYLASWGRAFRRRVQILPYEHCRSLRESPTGTYIFSDIERLDASQRAAAARLRERLLERGARVLNDPIRTLRRFDLLRALRERGVNSHGAWRVAEGASPEHFPVFIRGENDHDGSLTPLLATRAEMETAVDELVARGRRREDLIVVEFCDTSDASGIFRKYSVQIVADRVLPRHLFFGRRWMLKAAELGDAALLAEERQYMAENPHQEAMRQACTLAGLEYGRVDYGVDRDGATRVWELNTNPMLVTHELHGVNWLRIEVHAAFAERFGAALHAIDMPAGPPIPLPPLPELPDALPPRPSLRRRLGRWVRGLPDWAHYYWYKLLGARR